MNKIIVIAFALAGCATSPEFKERIIEQNFIPCIEASKFIDELGGNRKQRIDYKKLFKENSTGLQLELGQFANAYEMVCENKSARIYRVDSSDFNSWIEDGKTSERDLIIISGSPQKPNRLSREDRYSASSLSEVVDELRKPINELKKLRENDDLKSLDQVYTFKDEFEYPDFKGKIADEAKEKRGIIFGEFVKNGVLSVSRLVKRQAFTRFLDENVPMPIAQGGAQYSLIKEKIAEIKNLLPLTTEENTNKFENEPNKTFWGIQKVVFGYGESPYLCGGECKEAVKRLIKSKEQREYLTKAYLFSVSSFDFVRSEDKKKVFLTVTVDLPKMLKEFEFKKISDYLEK